MTTTDELLAQVKASRSAGSFDPVRGAVRDHFKPASIFDPQVRLLEALAGIDLSPSELRTLLWVLNWDSLDNIAAMVRKRCEIVAAGTVGREA